MDQLKFNQTFRHLQHVNQLTSSQPMPGSNGPARAIIGHAATSPTQALGSVGAVHRFDSEKLAGLATAKQLLVGDVAKAVLIPTAHPQPRCGLVHHRGFTILLDGFAVRPSTLRPSTVMPRIGSVICHRAHRPARCSQTW